MEAVFPQLQSEGVHIPSNVILGLMYLFLMCQP